MGTSVDAVDAPVPGPVLVAEFSYDGRGSAWRLEPDAPAGRVADSAVGVRTDVLGPGRITADLDGDGDQELRFRDLDEDVVLFDLGQLGELTAGDAWLRSGDRADGQWYAAQGAPDLNGDGHADLTVVFEATVDTWYGPLDPATFSIEQPDARTSYEPTTIKGVFGLRTAGGTEVFLVIWDHTEGNPGDLLRLQPGQALTDAVGVDAGDGVVAIGSLDAAAGEDVLVRDAPESRLFSVDDSGTPWATGFALEASPDAGAAGDFDGDGVDDLAVIGFEAVYVFRGPLAPGTVTYDDADLRVSSGVADDDFGADLAAADLDGDGRDDLVVGAPQDDGLAPDGGAVYLWRGLDLFP